MYEDQPYTEDGSLAYEDQPYIEEYSDDSVAHEEQSNQQPFSEERIDDSTPLYAGASITVNVTMILLLAFAIRHRLTNEAISDLLFICPKPNNTCKTLYNPKTRHCVS